MDLPKIIKYNLLLTITLFYTAFGYCNKSHSDDSLFKVEKDFISDHPEIIVGFRGEWPPYEFTDTSGNLKGFIVDYFNLISRKTGLKYKIVIKNWKDIYEDIIQNKIDVVPDVQRLPDREKYLSFTTSFIAIRYFIVCRQDYPNIKSFADLKGKSLTLLDKWAMDYIISEKFPGINVVRVENFDELISNAFLGKTDAILIQESSLEYLSHKYKFSGLHVAFVSPYTVNISIGVRKNNPILYSILQKAVSSVAKEQTAHLENKWFSNNFDLYTYIKQYYIISIPIFLLLVVIVLLVIFLLRRQVKIKTAQLQAQLITINNQHDELDNYRKNLEEMVIKKTADLVKANQDLALLNETLTKTNDELKISTENLTNEIQQHQLAEQSLDESRKILDHFIHQSVEGITISDENGKIIVWNGRISEITGITEKEALSKYTWDIDFEVTQPQNENKGKDEIKSLTLQRFQKLKPNSRVTFTGKIKARNAEEKFIESTIFIISTSNRRFYGQITRDVTEKKRIEAEIQQYQEKVMMLLAKQTQKSRLLSQQLNYIFDNTTDYISIFEIIDNKIILSNCNANWASSFGVSIGDILGKPIEKIFNADHNAIRLFIIDSFNKRETSYLEALEFYDDNQTKYLDITAIPITGRADQVALFARDVTERQKLLSLLKERQAYINTIIENLPLEFWALNSNSEVTLQSEFTKKLRGNWIGYHIDEVKIEKNLKNVAITGFQKALKGERLNSEIENKSNDKIEYYLGLMTPVISENTIIGALAIVIDFTEQKLAYLKLQESESKFFNIFNNSLDTISLIDYETRKYIDVNNAYHRVIGLKRDEVIGKTREEVNLWYSEIERLQYYSLLESNGNIQNFELQWNVKDGPHYFLVSTEVIVLGSRKTLLTTSKDINEFKKVSLSLQESEEKFRNIFNSSADGILVLGLNRQIIDVNVSFYKPLGYTIDTVMNAKSYFEFVKPEYHSQLEERIKLLQVNQEVPIIELEIIAADGSFVQFELNSKPITYHNEGAILVLARDVSERKKVEQKILGATIQAEERERRKLAADLHDEVGPLLSSMNMNLSLLARRQVTDEQKQMLNEIISILKDTIATVREISHNISPQVLSAYGLVSAINTFITDKRKLINIKFDHTISFQRLSEVKELMLYRIVKELVNNTLKYANAKEIQIFLEENKNHLKFSYRDNGKGFNPSELSLKPNKGLGLLSIINRVNTIGGWYSMNSSPGNGFQMEIIFTID